MNKTERLELVTSQTDARLQSLGQFTLGSEDFSRAVETINQLLWLEERLSPEDYHTSCQGAKGDHAPGLMEALFPQTLTDDEPETFTGAGDPGVPGKPGVPTDSAQDEAPVPTPEPQEDYKALRLTLRGELAEAKRKGIVVAELIKSVGAGKYSDVPDDLLRELQDKLRAALEENG